MTTKADREVARLLDEADPAALDLAELVATDIRDSLKYHQCKKLVILIEHFPNTLLKALR